MREASRKIAVIGAGPMGLGVAYYLGKQGLPVTLYEAGESGDYEATLRDKRLPGNDTLPAVMAVTKDHVVVARADGKVINQIVRDELARV